MNRKHEAPSQELRTAKLWTQYMKYINVIKTFIRAERSGNWEGHLRAIVKNS